MTHIPLPNRIPLRAVTTANSTASLPANGYITDIVVRNNTANAITGGLKFGTSAGATDIVVALTVGASSLTFVTDAAILKRIFSTSVAQIIYIDTVTLWNSASVDIDILYTQL